MPIRKVFNDENDNEMDCYLNSNGQIFIEIGQSGAHVSEKNFITLDKGDTNELIKMLTEIEKDMID